MKNKMKNKNKNGEKWGNGGEENENGGKKWEMKMKKWGKMKTSTRRVKENRVGRWWRRAENRNRDMTHEKMKKK